MKNIHFWLRFLAWKDSLTMRANGLLMRRPHRSFRRTRRRDYNRSLVLPGYWALTAHVSGTLWRHKKLFGTLLLVFTAVVVLVGGVTNQQIYQQINDLVNQAGGEVIKGAFGSVGQAALLLVATFASPGELTGEQQIYLGFGALMVWLTTVWLLRELLAGGAPKLRDGLYSAGAPIVSTALLVLVAIVQLVPAGLVALVYTALSGVGILQEGFSAYIFWLFAMLIATLVLYWTTATFLALVIVTLPGMYPLRALRAAGDLVIGRRLRILYRLIWGTLWAVAGWAVVMILVILLDAGIKNLWPAIKPLPLAPLAAAFMGTATMVWLAAYVYLLYRRIVDDGSSPA